MPDKLRNVYLRIRGSQIKMGAVISYLAIAVNCVTALLYLPWMAGVIGQTNYGLYMLASSFISLFMVDFGLGSAVSRFLAKYRAEGRKEEADYFMSVIMKLYLLIDAGICIVLFILWFFLDRIYTGLEPAEISVFRTLYLIVGFFSIISFPFEPLSGVLTAYEKFIQLKICDMGQKLFSVALIVMALLLGYGVEAVVLANAASSLIFIVMKAIIVFMQIPVRIRLHTAKRNDGVIWEMLSFSIWTTVSTLASRCIFSLASSILGILSNSREIAVFAPASALEGYFFSFAAAVNGMFLARISKYVAKNEEDRIFDLMVKIGRYQLIALGLIYTEFICVGREFMVLWMGREYEKAYYCAILLFLPDFFMYTEQIANTMVIAKNEIKRQAIGSVFMAVICVGVSVRLCGKLGALGSSIGIMCGFLFMFFYMNVVYSKRLGIDIRRFFKEAYLGYFIPFGVSLVISSMIIERGYTQSGWIHFGVKCCLVGLIYFVVIVVLCRPVRDAVIKAVRR